MGSSSEKKVQQIVSWGEYWQEREAPASTMCVTTGRRLYLLGDIDGRFRPRSNPYDIYAFGKPKDDDPLANRLQGVWAQPVKALSGFTYALEADGQFWTLDTAQTFLQAMDSLRFVYRQDGLEAERVDTAALDLPFLLTTLTVSNRRSAVWEANLHFTVQFDLRDAWFTQLADHRNEGQTVSVEDGCLIARADACPERWAVAVGGVEMPDRIWGQGDSGSLVLRLRLAPGEKRTVAFGVAAASTGGAAEALSVLRQGLAQREQLRAEKLALYTGIREHGPRLESGDAALDRAFALAQANIHLLEADPPALGRCCYAGLEMFPFWFSCDGAYSIPGMLIANLRETALSHTRIGLRFLDAGRVPHQVSPAGHVAFAGNAEETPLWVMGIWDAYRWTGDQKFLAELFPAAWQGMLEYVLGTIDTDGDGYPSGPGMVEVDGMGAEKLDSAAYTWAALGALAEMAAALGKPEQAAQARDRAAAIQARFTADWWDAGGGTYAMSLEDPGNRRFPIPHWAVITPLEVGLAEAGPAAETFATLRRGYLNRWGLKHTAGEDERVWTLPTAALSRAAFQYGEPQLGLDMLRNISETLNHGSIGLFHEIIPQGACILQLWSAATFLRGIVEDLLGVTVLAGEHILRVEPRIPAGWGNVTLRNLRFGDHCVSLFFTAQGVRVEHHTPAIPLRVVTRNRLDGDLTD